VQLPALLTSGSTEHRLFGPEGVSGQTFFFGTGPEECS